MPTITTIPPGFEVWYATGDGPWRLAGFDAREPAAAFAALYPGCWVVERKPTTVTEMVVDIGERRYVLPIRFASVEIEAELRAAGIDRILTSELGSSDGRRAVREIVEDAQEQQLGGRGGGWFVRTLQLEVTVR